MSSETSGDPRENMHETTVVPLVILPLTVPPPLMNNELKPGRRTDTPYRPAGREEGLFSTRCERDVSHRPESPPAPMHVRIANVLSIK